MISPEDVNLFHFVETAEEAWGVLAAEYGYYDQAHLARDFRDLAGCPPSVWLAEEFRNVQALTRDNVQALLA